MSALSIPELGQYARAAGFQGDALVMIVAIALRESGGDPRVIGDIDNPHAGCRSYGLVQINVCPQGTAGGNNAGIAWREHPETLLDPVTNFRAAYSMSNGGANFGPWTTYRAGIPAPDVARVRAELGNAPAVVNDPTVVNANADPTTPSAPDIFQRLSSWETWRRVLYILGGFGLAAFGLAILNRSQLGRAVGSLSTASKSTASKLAKAPNDPDDGGDDDAAVSDDDLTVHTIATHGAL